MCCMGSTIHWQRSTYSVCLDVIRTSLQTKAFRQKWLNFYWQGVVQLRSLLIRPLGTVGQIEIYEQHTNHMSHALSSSLSYPVHLFRMGKSYSTINLHRSMFFMTVGPIHCFQVGTHSLTIQSRAIIINNLQ
jgi:hypothetical protein